jgi:hypothetical protein
MLSLLPPQTSADPGSASGLPALATASNVHEELMLLDRRAVFGQERSYRDKRGGGHP